MRSIILFPKLHILVPLESAIPALAKGDHTLFALTSSLWQLGEPRRLDGVQAADVVENAFGFEQAGVVNEFGGSEEGGRVGFLDGELRVEDEGEGGDFFEGRGCHCCCGGSGLLSLWMFR